MILAGFGAVGAAFAGDAGVPGGRLVLQARANGKSTVQVRLGKAEGTSKGAGAPTKDATGLTGTFEVFYTDAPSSVHGAFALPDDGWVANKTKAARYARKGAPAGGLAVASARIRNGKSAALVAKALGERAAVFDLDAPLPSDDGGLTTVLTIENTIDKTLYRLCTKWAIAAGSKVRRKTTRKGTTLAASKGVPVACPPLQTAPEGCEVLNAIECLLPYPSSQFLTPASTATGFKLTIPQVGVPRPIGPEVPAEPFQALDGFSPGSQVLMHFPQGVDVAGSNAPRLLDVGCCGQPTTPPWIDTRTVDGRSLESDSPTVLLDADTGERLLHFIENDARAADPARVITFLKPGRILEPGHRYIVAVRGLVAPDGAPVAPEPSFRYLRDGIVTDDAAIEARRAHFESDVFPTLTAAGIARSDLILAFDFVVASEDDLSGVMRSMRDQAYAWLDTVEADAMAKPFTITNVTENDCNQPNTPIWRTITGTFDVPLFLENDIDDTTTPYTPLDENGVPVQNGFHHARLFASIPCSMLEPVPVGQPVLMGHGLFQTGDLFTNYVPTVVAQEVPWTGIAVATDWRGLSGLDLGWVGSRIIGFGQSELHRFQAFPARLRQGMLNTLVLARLMKKGLLNRDPAFQIAATGVFPGQSEQVYYFGISLGGIMGTYLAALTPDIERFGLDVGAVNFNCMLQRATPFVAFYDVIEAIGFTDAMKLAIGLSLTHEFWARAEPVSVVHHVTSDPYPGSGDAKRVFYSAAWLDKQVSNTCTEIAARTMNLPVLQGSIQTGLQQMPDATEPQPSALVFHHNGELDITNPAHAPFIPPLANLFPSDVCDPHPRHASIRAAIHQLLDFFTTGLIANFCTDGLCDGDDPTEQPLLGQCTPG
jgi:pimeloyl-ACP methyl ester carboxylesterase